MQKFPLMSVNSLLISTYEENRKNEFHSHTQHYGSYKISINVFLTLKWHSSDSPEVWNLSKEKYYKKGLWKLGQRKTSILDKKSKAR